MTDAHKIIIDEYDPKHPHIVWECDNCGGEYPVTAQFKIPIELGEDRPLFITLCRACLERAIAGIDDSLANPVDFDLDAPEAGPE